MNITASKLRSRGCCANGVNNYFRYIKRKSWDAAKLLEQAIEWDDYRDAAVAIASQMTAAQRYQWVRCRGFDITWVRAHYDYQNRPQKLRRGLAILLKSESL